MFSLSPPKLIILTFALLILTLALQQAHLLSILLTLELMILITSLWAVLTNPPSPFILILLLTPAVCEATLGLALFISLTRSSGSPMIKTLNTQKW